MTASNADKHAMHAQRRHKTVKLPPNLAHWLIVQKKYKFLMLHQFLMCPKNLSVLLALFLQMVNICTEMFYACVINSENLSSTSV